MALTEEQEKIKALLSRFAAEVSAPNRENRPLMNRTVRWSYWFDEEKAAFVLKADLLATTDPVGLVPTVSAAKGGSWWTIGRTIMFAWQVPHSAATMHELLMEKILA